MPKFVFSEFETVVPYDFFGSGTPANRFNFFYESIYK